MAYGSYTDLVEKQNQKNVWEIKHLKLEKIENMMDIKED